MSELIPGLDKLKKVIAQASIGPFTVEFGTIFDAKQEMVADMCAPEDAAAIATLLWMKDEIVALIEGIGMLPGDTIAEKREIFQWYGAILKKLESQGTPSKQPES